MRTRAAVLFGLVVSVVVAPAVAGVKHSSIGVCPRKDEFAKRQAALDPIVASLSTETSKSNGMVRDAAANARGHLGGTDARTTRRRRRTPTAGR